MADLREHRSEGAVKAGSTLRRRGRPQRLPEDPHSLSSRTVGCDQRVAWLLATSRMLHPDPELTRRERFVAAVKERGIAVDNSRISRWESGATPVPDSVLNAYEDVLGLGEGTLVTVTGGMRRLLGSGPLPRQHDEPTREYVDLDRLLSEVERSTPTHGLHWQLVAAELTRHDRVYLRQAEWATLCQRLVVELSRAVGLGYVRRYEAAARLIRHPSARRHLSRALGSFVMNPDTQVVAPVLALLTEVDDQAAADLLLRMLRAESRGLRRSASSVLASKLRLGQIPESALPQVEEYAARALRRGEPLDGALDAFDLAIQLPSASYLRVMDSVNDRRIQAQLGRARSVGELLTRQQAAAVVADLAADIERDMGALAPGETDMMLRRLLREAMFHTHKQRRHHAGLLLAASPYRRAVARQCHRLTGASNYFIAARAWTLLMRVGHAGRRSEILLQAMSETRPTLKARALVNLGLSPEPISEAESRTIAQQLDPEARGSVRHGTIFALAMSGSPAVADLAEHEDARTRRAAAWWLEHGPAIHDPVRPVET